MRPRVNMHNYRHISVDRRQPGSEPVWDYFCRICLRRYQEHVGTPSHQTIDWLTGHRHALEQLKLPRLGEWRS